MTTDVIGTGGDFATIALWEADIPATLTERREGLLKNQVFTEAVDFSGHTTTASFDIILRTDAGASFKDNLDPDTDALFYNTALGAAVQQGADYFNTILYGSTNHVTLSGIQVAKTVNNAGRVVSGVGSSTRAWQIEDCILEDEGSGSVLLGGDDSSMVNTLLITDGDGLILSGGSPFFVNCGFKCTGTGDVVRSREYVTETFRNCYAFSFTAWFGVAANIDCPNCATDAASINNGTGDSTGEQVGLTASDQFVNAANDFRLKVLSDLIGAASRQQAFTNDLDIIGQPRSITTPDVGPWEFQVPTGGGGVTGADVTDSEVKGSAVVAAGVTG